MIDTHCHFLQALTSHRPQALKYYPGGGYKGLRNTCWLLGGVFRARPSWSSTDLNRALSIAHLKIY
jgi:hypothetical protein